MVGSSSLSPRTKGTRDEMEYIPEDPEVGEAFTIPLLDQCPKLRAMFQALRHGCPPPHFSDYETDNEPPKSTSSIFSSDESQSLTTKSQLAPFQETLIPPTDFECGLPSAVSVARSEIPTPLLPLSHVIASSQKAAVINHYSRDELQEALAHAANLRRATGRARAILVIASSERAVSEWIAGMCQTLDEVQIISYSRTKTKRQATLSRLRQTQYPGIVVAAEKTLRDGIRELWEALRENRIVKKWELVVSEALSDKSVESECSPLRMIRDGTAEKGIIIAKKGLSKTKTCMFAGSLSGIDVDKRFWLSKADIQNIALEESQEANGSNALIGDDKNDGANVADKIAGRSKGRKSKLPEGKENRLLPRIVSGTSSKTSGETAKLTQGTRVTGKGRSKTPDSVKGKRHSKEPNPEVDRIVRAVQSTSRTCKISDGVVKAKRRRQPSPHTKGTSNDTISGSVKMSAELESLLSKKEAVGGRRISSETPVSRTVGKRSLSDSVKRALLRDAVETVVKKTTPKNRKSPEIAIQSRPPRRRSPRLSPTLLSNEQSSVSAVGRSQSKQRRRQSNELRLEEDWSSKNRSTVRTKKASTSLGSSKMSTVDGKRRLGSTQDDSKAISQKTREKHESRACALRLYTTESSDSGEELFYTPPSQAPTPRSKDTTPEKFFSPRTSFSPKKPFRSSTELAQETRETRQNPVGSRSSVPSRSNKTQILKQTTSKPHKSSAQKCTPSGSSSSPLEIADDSGKRDGILNLSDSSLDNHSWPRKLSDINKKTSRQAPMATSKKRVLKSDNQRLSRKLSSSKQTRRRTVDKALKNRRLDLGDASSNDHPLSSKISDRKRKATRKAVMTALRESGPDLVDESSSDQWLVRNISDLKEKSERRVVKEAVTPPIVKRSFPSSIRPFQDTIATGGEASKGRRRRSVFEGLVSQEVRSDILDTAIRRTKSVPEPVQVKQEGDPPSRGFIWTWGNPRYRASSAGNRRKSVPRSSSSASILPVKRVIPEQERKSQMTTPRTITPRNVPRAMRSSPKDRRDSTTPRSKAPLDRVSAQPSSIVPEVIVISSGSEDEELLQRERISKKRRIFDHDEVRNDSGISTRASPRNGTTSRRTTPSPIISPPRDRPASGSGSQSRPTEQNGTATARSVDLASFMRGVNRKRKLQHLTHQQRVWYNKLVAEGKRFESLGKRKQAFDSYEECLEIYDGDSDLINRYIAMASTEGYFLPGDIPRRHSKSPIKKRPRRRRQPGRRVQAGASSSRVEVIDLTSS